MKPKNIKMAEFSFNMFFFSPENIFIKGCKHSGLPLNASLVTNIG